MRHTCSRVDPLTSLSHSTQPNPKVTSPDPLTPNLVSLTMNPPQQHASAARRRWKNKPSPTHWRKPWCKRGATFQGSTTAATSSMHAPPHSAPTKAKRTARRKGLALARSYYGHTTYLEQILAFFAHRVKPCNNSARNCKALEAINHVERERREDR